MTIYVADLSNNNGRDIDFAAIRAAGYTAVILKASEGSGFRDPRFLLWARQAAAAGLEVGAYHFLLPDEDGVAQAAVFNQMSDAAGINTVIRCCDAETTGRGSIETTVRAFCPAARCNLLYSGAYFAQSELSDPIAGVDWWIAAYGTAQRPRAPWGVEAGWQFSEHGKVPGVPGDCDVSIFDDAVWAQLTGQAQGDDVSLPQAVDEQTGGTWTVKPDGSVFTDDNAPYLGGLNNHPAWNAGTAVAISWWKGDGTNGGGLGYKITTENKDGTLAYYRFPRRRPVRSLMADADPYTTREIKDKFDSFGRDLTEIRQLLTSNTFVRADVYEIQIRNHAEAISAVNQRINAMQGTVRNLAIVLAGAVVTGILTALLTVHP